MRSDKGPWKDAEVMRVGLQFISFCVFFPLASLLSYEARTLTQTPKTSTRLMSKI